MVEEKQSLKSDTPRLGVKKKKWEKKGGKLKNSRAISGESVCKQRPEKGN